MVDLTVADDDEEEGEEEDLRVDQAVVDAVPGLGVYAEEDVVRPVSLHVDLLLSEVLKEVDRSALIEVLSRVFQHSEHYGLWRGAENRDDPGPHHQSPGPGSQFLCIDRSQRSADTQIPSVISY